MHKKYFILITIILLACSSLFLFEYYPGLDSNTSNTDSTGGELAMFNAEISKLGANIWDKSAFYALKSKIDLYQSHNSITEDEAKSLNKSLLLTYTETMRAEFNKWLDNNCEVMPAGLYSEMLKHAYSDTDVKTMLTLQIQAYMSYNYIMNIQPSVTRMLNDEYDNIAYNALVTKINANAGSLTKDCVEDTVNSVLYDLDEFKDFAETYNLYKKGTSTYSGLQAYLKYCSTTDRINYYKFYIQEYNEIKKKP